ncbi:MAG: sialate O-acetylesterase [Planctomycetota bacterium]
MNTHRWTLQESLGTRVVDDLGHNDGTIDGTVTLGAAGPGGSLLLATAFAGGSTSSITLDDTFMLSRKHDWSIKFWALQDVLSNEGMLLGDRATPVSFIWLSSSQGGLVVRPAHSVEVTGSNDGLDIIFSLPAATVTKWSEYELTYEANGAESQLTLTVDGTVVAMEVASSGVELRVNTLGGGHNNGVFSLRGRLANVEMVGTEIDYAKPDKTILVLGQSNADGRFGNHQAYSHPTQFASKFQDGEWSELLDDGTYGTVWPLLATRWLTDRNESIGFIYAAVGGTGLVDDPDWAAGGAIYDAAIDIVLASAAENIDAVLWFQGERDANQDVSRADYAAAMDDLIQRLHNDLPGSPPLVCGQINSVQDGTSDEVRNAQSDSWANVHICPGPVTYDIGPLADDLHFTTDSEAETLADRWWAAVDEALFDGTVGTPPSLLSAVIDGSEIVLTYDRDLEDAADYDPVVWSVYDNGMAIGVTSAWQITPRTVGVTLEQAPISSNKPITLATGYTAQGQEVPRGIGKQPALPETIALKVLAQQDGGSLGAHEPVKVNKVRRAVSVA